MDRIIHLKGEKDVGCWARGVRVAGMCGGGGGTNKRKIIAKKIVVLPIVQLNQDRHICNNIRSRYLLIGHIMF